MLLCLFLHSSFAGIRVANIHHFSFRSIHRAGSGWWGHGLRALCRASGGPGWWAECCLVNLVAVEAKQEANGKEHSSRVDEIGLGEEAKLVGEM